MSTMRTPYLAMGIPPLRACHLGSTEGTLCIAQGTNQNSNNNVDLCRDIPVSSISRQPSF